MLLDIPQLGVAHRIATDMQALPSASRRAASGLARGNDGGDERLLTMTRFRLQISRFGRALMRRAASRVSFLMCPFRVRV
jgi:hypothetical protein